MNDIYYAAPLFNSKERAANNVAVRKLREAGYKVYLPQESGLVAERPEDGYDLYRKDIMALKDSKCVIADVSGTAADPGTCFEIGFMAAENKPILLFADCDSRIRPDSSGLNLMLRCAGPVFGTFEELLESVKNMITPSEL